MLDLGFIEDVERILRMCPGGRQTSLFSATIPPPDRPPRGAAHVRPGDDPRHPQAAHGRRDRAGLRRVPGKQKTDRLVEVLRAEEQQAIIFCRTKVGAARLDKTLRDRGLDVKALHGDMTQGQRDG